MPWRSSFLLANALGAVIIGSIENLNYTDSFYLTVSASTTTGYGNVSAETDAGKLFISFYSVLGVAAFFTVIARLNT